MVRITEELVRKKSEHNELLISTLEELSLHQEDIERIEHLHNWCRDLKILLLQSNLISKIENLYKLKRLEYLNLALNNIERIENLQQLESLNKLDLTLNFIGELTSIESLKDNYNLRILILTGNPCCDYAHYREYVIATLPQLDSLDCQEVTLTHKLQTKPHLREYRAAVVQKQALYAIQRDEQKIRFQQQKQELEAKMSTIEDECERIKVFWDSKSENCPEIRNEMAKYQKMCRQKVDDSEEKKPPKKEPNLFAPCGRPYNINKPQLPFALKDEVHAYILELEVYKYLDTSHIKVDVEVNYIRAVVKGKIFQIALNDEVRPSDAIVQRSQITGQLVITAPKLNENEILLSIKSEGNDMKNTSIMGSKQSHTILTGTVDIKSICNNEDDLPDLI
ncbi:protein tilB [Stomoxys calcitrans]|uniref:protein tilB n=1 Tax=Stomoxys calcitrans TaxID=35570 RepID=UPI0027E25D1C|nr:protein tilB [Stomoxys calcitrans]